MGLSPPEPRPDEDVRYAPGMENDDIATAAEAPAAPADLIEELLVEEISIDGMCGVY